MPVGMGILVGVLSFIPYIQVLGLLPAALLSLLQMADTGSSFWGLMALVLVVYIVVQILQDTIFTPRIMGQITGLSPAVVLLSLSVWGYIAGIIGLMVALPLTTLMLAYYQRYVLEESSEETSFEEETLEMARLTQRAMRVLREVSHNDGFNIGMNQGKVGGAGIADHLHQHILPRWSGDTNFLPIIAHTKTMSRTLDDMRQIIADGFARMPS